MEILAEFRARILEILEELASGGVLPPDSNFSQVTVSSSRDERHGDLACNAALVLARPAKRDPRELANLLAAELRRDSRVVAAEVAGPGFVNIHLDPEVLVAAIPSVLRAGREFGRSDLGAGARVNVEFVSANPTGPLHIGHARGAVFGDALASVLEFCGYSVTREYYVNDAGSQVDALARSAHLRYREALGETVELPADAYPGDYLSEVGKQLAAEFGERFLGKPELEWLLPVRRVAVNAMMKEIRADLVALGVRMDNFVSERALQDSGRIEETIERLRAKDLVYRGTLPPPKGMPKKDWKSREQLLFRSTKFGDDVDRPLQKEDNSWTYFAPDMAYHADKISRGFEILINVWGEDHGGYLRRMRAAVAALSEGSVDIDIKICKLARLLRRGEPFAMSKRKGNIVLLQDFLEEVGRDVARFVLLTRKNDAPLDFDVERGLEQSRDNPVFYVHYAHARVCSALRRAGDLLEGRDLSDAALAEAAGDRLRHAAELTLVRRIAEWPAIVRAAAMAHEPHRISFYLQSLAAEFHALWTAGKTIDELRFVREDDPEGSLARLALIRAVAVVIATGLGILGIEPREEMR